jgi:hypothetical protein
MEISTLLVTECTDQDRPSRSWVAAMGNQHEAPSAGFATSDGYEREAGLGEVDLGIGADCIIDPDGCRQRAWFHVAPDGTRREVRTGASG